MGESVTPWSERSQRPLLASNGYTRKGLKVEGKEKGEKPCGTLSNSESMA